MLCAAVVPPTMPEADFGIFYMDDVQYLDMCGHASIGVGMPCRRSGWCPRPIGTATPSRPLRVWCGSRTISRRTIKCRSSKHTAGAKKRLKISKKGKVIRGHAYMSHLLNGHGKTAKSKRHARGTTVTDKTSVKAVKKMLPYA